MNCTTMQEFCKTICISLTKILGNNCEVEYKEVVKNNGVRLHGIMITRSNCNVTPAIYVDRLYVDYLRGRELGSIVKEILDCYRASERQLKVDMNFFTDYEKARKRILYKLVSRKRNERLLEETPYLKWNDLAVVFYYLLEDMGFGNATVLIKNAHLIMWEKDVKTIWQDAVNNMPRLQPEELRPIGEALKDYFYPDGGGEYEKEFEYLDDDGDGKAVMYILSNRSKFFGAATLLYSKEIKELADRLGKNLIILPSSVHEVLIMPDIGRVEAASYREMVRDVNDTQLAPEEILSYSVYYYDRMKERITLM